jgi:signal transduction histidine kinase
MPDRLVEIKESEIFKLIDKNRALDATYKLVETILVTTEFDELTQKIADIIPNALGYELGILALIDHKSNVLKKISLSKGMGDIDKQAQLEEFFGDLTIPFGYADNVCVQAIETKKQIVSPYMWDVFKPTLTRQQAESIQEITGTRSHIVTPLFSHDRVIGAIIVSLAKEVDNVSEFEKDMLKKFSESAGVAVENSKLYTNLKRAKEDLHKAYENMKVLNTLKDEFLSVASHELRTPMTIVKSYLWMLEKQKAGKLNQKQLEYLNKALVGTQRMISLINDMLDISKFERKKVSFSITQINLINTIKDVLSNFEVRIGEKGLKMEFTPPADEILVDADPEKLRDVFTNLIENSVKFTKDGTIAVSIDEYEEFYRISVKDTGAGIDKKDLPKLFHKFGRIDNSYTIATDSGGTGLGLYIVKLYIHGMGGMVGADSEGMGMGSTFWITLPKNKIKKFGVNLKQVEIPV